MSLKVPVHDQDHAQGSADAKCTLVEYGDYECPHCGHAYPIVKRVQKHFGKKLRFVFRNFPLAEMHPNAESAAETAEFAGAHKKFWEMHDGLFENQEQLGGQLYLQLAQELGLSPQAWREAVEKREFLSRVKSDFTGGVRSGVNGTPTFFINGKRHDASFEYADLVEAIDAALASE
ncbi:MAG TPA: thioredoxin domain-containing protein [Candidatus Acidoferrales bacterium]|jgi:protein-disulfide isomerase|nr:thioredoxin domain-containing protein [Candidatus Acidoferrales bacterium]